MTNSYFFRRWPLASEIAAQYVFLLLADMKASRHLKLPYRAMTCNQVPLSVLKDSPKLIAFTDAAEQLADVPVLDAKTMPDLTDADVTPS